MLRELLRWYFPAGFGAVLTYKILCILAWYCR